MRVFVINKRNRAYTGNRWYIGRPSPLGNPFEINVHGTRQDVVLEYDIWLRDQLKRGDTPAAHEFGRLLAYAQLNEVALECWCSPLQCHGDIILRELMKSASAGAPAPATAF
jgi:hypothetical protein